MIRRGGAEVKQVNKSIMKGFLDSTPVQRRNYSHILVQYQFHLDITSLIWS
jgi:hypothetical protein